MRILKQLIFIMFVTAGLTLTASAQRQDPKKPPPKGPDRPVVRPGDKPVPKERPRERERDRDRDRRPQRPDEMSFVIVVERSRNELA